MRERDNRAGAMRKWPKPSLLPVGLHLSLGKNNSSHSSEPRQAGGRHANRQSVLPEFLTGFLEARQLVGSEVGESAREMSERREGGGDRETEREFADANQKGRR